MPIYLQHGNLIVSKKALTEKYQGGIAQFKHDFKDSELEEDDELISMASMGPTGYPDLFLEKGLRLKNNQSEDFVILDRYQKPSWVTTWLDHDPVFFWHKQCSSELLKEVEKRGKTSILDMTEEESEDFFKPIRLNN